MAAERTHTVHSPLPRRLAAWVGFPLLGTLAGAAIMLVIELMAKGALHHGAAFPAEWLRIAIGALVGLAAGLLLAVGHTAEELSAKVSDSTLELTWDQVHAVAPRHSVAAVIADHDIVVLLRDGRELARVARTIDVDRLEAALAAHGYPGLTRTDPNEAEFTAWHEGSGRLTDSLDRYIAAYSSSMAAHARTDAEHLRRALVAQGVAVRYRHGAAEWRPLARLRVPVAA